MDHLHLKVLEIVPETDNAATFYLENEAGDLPYEAGQFLTFLFDEKGHDLRRSYSFSSTPGLDHTPSITLKRIANGAVSRYFFDHLRKGDRLQSLPASGRFTIATDPQFSRKFIFIAAGSGISPVFSLMQKILVWEPFSDIFLIYQNHDENHIIFRKRLLQLKEDYPERFRWISLVSTPIDHSLPPVRLTNFLLEQLVTAYVDPGPDSSFYLCGPPSFMRMAQFTLRLMGIALDQIKRENFTVEYVPHTPFLPDKKSKNITIHFQGQTYQFPSAYPKTILQTALDRHIELPYSCKAGRCSTCTARLIRGSVLMSINEVLTDKDLTDGLVLTCVGYPETDVELSF